MSRKRRRRAPLDLEPYGGCPDDDLLGIVPLAVGWLERQVDYAQGEMPAAFLDQLALFCQPDYIVCHTPGKRPCPLCGDQIDDFGGGEIRAIGKTEIYASPDLILHFVRRHNYAPPPPFVEAIMTGPMPASPEHRALRRVYAL